MTEQDTFLELYRGDELLGTLSTVKLEDWPWYTCHFQPTSAFNPYKPLFDRELELLNDQGATDEWDVAYQQIENLGLSLQFPNQAKKVKFFLLHIDGQTATLKAIFD